MSRIKYLLIAMLLITTATFAQSITNYTFSASSGTFTALSGATSPALSGGSNDEGWYNSLPIGFTFWYMGVGYTTVSASTNGWFTFNQALTATGYSNNLTSGTPRPVIGPLWDDIKIDDASGTFSYKTEGSAPDRIFTAQWLNVKWNYGATTPAISFQVKLYETTGKVEFIYRQEAGAVVSGSASIGITGVGTGSGNFLSLDGTGASPNASSTVETPTLNTKPATGQVYTFTPVYTTSPAAPLGPIVFSSVTTSSMTLGWTDNSTTETFFVVRRAKDASFTQEVVTTYVNSTTTAGTGTGYTSNQTGLLLGTTYYFRIFAANEASPPSDSITGNQATNFGTVFGTKWIINGYTATDTYPSFTAAITDLNTNLVGSGGVTFLVDAGQTFTENPPALTAYGTATCPIVFQRNGVGANPIVSRTDAGTLITTVLGGQGDAVITIDGGDYITFDGINVTASDQGIEYGYYLRKLSATDGCKNLTIKNCNITMTKGTSRYVVGIYSSNNDVASLVSSATGITVTSEGGRHENVFITGDTIQNVFAGIVLRGFYHTSSPYNFYDQNFVVGTSGAGNTIRNYAGNFAAEAYGVYIIYHNNPNVSYNMINNTAGGGSNFTSTGYGIFYSSATNASGTLNNNQINLTSNTGQLRAIMFGTSSSGIGNYVCNNNIITLAMVGTSEATCIYATGTVNSFTINNNTFSYGTFGSTTTSYLIYANTATNNVTVSGNATSGAINKTGTYGTFYGYYDATAPTGGTEIISGNNFSNITVTGSSPLYPIYSSTSTTQNRVAYNNTVSNLTSGTGYTYAMQFLYSLSNQVYNNVVNNITSGGEIRGLCFTGTNPTVYNNSVYQCSTSATTFRGIHTEGGTTVNIYNNKIYNMSTGASSGSAYGLFILSGTTVTAYNNMICDLKAPASTNATAVAGIYVSAGTRVNLYYNTVYLDATSSGGTTFGTTAIYAYYYTTLDMRNNVIVNVSTPGGGPTGKTVAYRRSSTDLTAYASTSNNNCFYAGTPDTNRYIYHDGTNRDTTLSAFKTRVTPRDANSVTENVVFKNVAVRPYDIHIDSTVATRLESGGLPITGITTDIDGNTRATGSKLNANVKPDIGADEFSGTPIDVVGPFISYTPLTNTGYTTNRTLTATITDLVSGVANDAGRMPRLVYKKNTPGASAYDSLTSSPWTFTFDTSKVGGVTIGDTIFYYVTATDSSNNTSTNPIGAPSTLNSYRILPSLSGAYNVGSDQPYTTVGAALAAWKNSAIAGNVTFTLMDANYGGETYPLVCTIPNAYDGGDWTLTIKPNSAKVQPTISGSGTNAIIDFNGVQRVTIDGSQDVSDTTKDLTISNTNSLYATIRFINGASNNTVKNCILKGNSTSYSNGVVLFSTAGATGNNNNLVQNCDVTKSTSSPKYGFVFEGSPAYYNKNNTISKCNVYDFSDYGIYFRNYDSTTTIQDCDIYTATQQTPAILAGIYIGSATVAYGPKILRNKIHDFWTSGASPTFYGVYLITGSVTTPPTVANNMISFDATTTHSNAKIYGIFEYTTSGFNTNIYYNSVYIGGSALTTTNSSYCLYRGAASTMDLKNNIFYNNRTQTSGTGKHYCIYSSAVAGLTSNYNDLYVPTPGLNGQYVGYWTADQTTLANWQTASTQDASSISANPDFQSATDLHISPSSTVVDQKGTPITGITKDFDNQNRHPVYPDIGADEYTPAVSPAVPTLVSPPDLATNVALSGQLVWHRDSFAEYYDVYLDTVTPPVNKVPSLQIETTYTYPNLSRGKWYYWQVVAWNDTIVAFKSGKITDLAIDAQSGASAIWTFRTINIDVGCTKIVAPVGTIDSGTVVTPACSLYNYGTTTETTYLVRMKIDGFYNDTARVTNHSAGTYKYLTFPTTWTAKPRGTFAVSCSTELATDMGTANDKATDSVTVRVRDVGTIAIIAPTDTILAGTDTSPRAMVKNFGTHTETFKVMFKIGSVYADTQTVTSLGPDSQTTVNFAQWTATESTYATKCSTMLATDQNTANDRITGNFTVARHDVGTISILAPTGTLLHGTLVTPRGRVKNFGLHTTETFNVVFKIGTVYSSTKSVNLGPLAETTVTFDNWTAVECNYATSCSTMLATDQNTANDKITEGITVEKHDVGAIAILYPIDTIFAGNIISPRAKVKNFGYHTTETFNVTFKIGAIYTNAQTVTNLGPRDSLDVLFDPWAAVVGNYNMTAYTALPGDQQLSNDAVYGTLPVVQPRANVGTIAILAPVDTILQNVLVTPRAIVKNYGSSPATFTVRFKVEGLYNQVITVQSLAANTQQEVTFPVWSPEPCNYVVSCSTELAADEVPENDKVTINITVRYRDVGVVSILVPRDTVESCINYTPLVIVSNNGVHAYAEVCTVAVKIIRYPAQMESAYCNIGVDMLHPVVVYDTWKIVEIPVGVETLSFPIFHPYWWDIYWIAKPTYHLVSADIKMAGDMNAGNDHSQNQFTVKGRSNDLEMNWTGLVDGYNTPMHSETLTVNTYNVASVVTNSPMGPTAKFRTRVKIVQEKTNYTVYSRCEDRVLPARTYSCVGFQAGWSPTDTGWYLVRSWVEALPWVDVVVENNAWVKHYYFTSEPVAKSGGEVNPSVQSGGITGIPTTFALMANKPNPFSSRTTIQWQIPVKSQVTISIYDATGRIVKTLVNNEFTPGYYNTTWNCTDNNNQKVAAGVYFYEMKSSNYTERLKMVITH